MIRYMNEIDSWLAYIEIQEQNKRVNILTILMDPRSRQGSLPATFNREKHLSPIVFARLLSCLNFEI